MPSPHRPSSPQSLGLLGSPFFEYWLPPGTSERPATERIRLRALTAFLIALLIVAPTFTVVDIIKGWYILAAPLAIASLSGLVFLFLIKRTGSLALVGNLCAGLLLICLSFNSAFNGGLHGGALKWLVVIPVVALVFAGKRSGVFWLSVVIGTFVTFERLHANDTFVQVMTDDDARINEMGTLVSLALFMAGIFTLYEEMRTWLTEQLEEANAVQIRSLLEAADDAILVVARGGDIVSVNESAEALFERPRARLKGTHLTALDGVLEELFVGGELQSGRQHVELASGTDEQRSFDLNSSPLPGKKEQNYIVVMRDVTEREDARRALERARDHALEIVETRGRFLANMSHELRTPLNAIIGYTEIMIEEIDDSRPIESKDDLLKIQQSGKHLLALINDVLDLSKLQQGAMPVVLDEVNVLDLCHEISGQIEPLASLNGNSWELTHELAPEATMTTDETKLKQILLNVLSNAAKFTNKGHISLRVRQLPNHIMFEVHDTGIGMTLEQQERVWEEFEQADISTTRRYGGTGLGLPLSRRLAKLLGGQLLMESAPGEGTTMTLTLTTIRQETL